MTTRSVLLYVLLVLAAAASWYVARDEEPADAAVSSGSSTFRGFYLKDARILGTSPDGALLYELEADRAEQTDDDTVDFENVRLYYAPESEVPWTVNADKAVIRNDQRLVALSGDVKVTTTGDAKAPATEILTSYLELDPDRFTAATDARVRITIGERSLTGTGMLASLADERLELQSNVSGMFLP